MATDWVATRLRSMDMSLAVEREIAPRDAHAENSYWGASRFGKFVSAHKHAHVTIIGSGIVGLTAAAALVRSGRSVTIIDEQPGPGQGASWGNGCQLSYGYVAPLANGGVWADIPHLLFSKDSPLRIVPRLDPSQWSWMLSFLAACNASKSKQSTNELLRLANLSRQETDAWMAQGDASALSFARSGKIVVLPTQAALDKAIAQVQLQLQIGLGPAQHAITEAECMRIEPALQRFRGKMAGAIYTPSECAVDSLALCRDLEQQLRKRQVRFLYSTKVQGFQRANGQVSAVVSDKGCHAVDGLVLATGVGSNSIARMLGFSVPVYPMKGYSISGEIVDDAGVPQASITDSAKKVVYARIGKRLRVAGFAEIQGYDRRADAQKIDSLIRSTREAFGDSVKIDTESAWAGLRPMTPTSMPIVRKSPVSNVFLNMGHGALGLTLAFGSARRLIDVIDAN